MGRIEFVQYGLTTDTGTNTVVTVLQKGYLLHDRVLRPALVVVSKAPSDT